MKRLSALVTVFMVSAALAGCVPTPGTATIAAPTPSQVSLTLEEAAQEVIQALAEKDLERLAGFVHPQQGVRFSPYTFVREAHQVFLPQQLTGLLASEAVYRWGTYDGSGQPIELSFEDYYEEFVYSSDFASAGQAAVNQRLGQGNTLNNILEFFPQSSFVDYYLPGTEDFGGMDWESLRLVFVEEDGTWLLVGIVHDEWTI